MQTSIELGPSRTDDKLATVPAASLGSRRAVGVARSSLYNCQADSFNESKRSIGLSAKSLLPGVAWETMRFAGTLSSKTGF
jgi:hypothetical protein